MGGFGIIAQQGYVVKSLDEAMSYWTVKLGVGPFYTVRPWDLPDMIYRGKRQHLSMNVAFAHSGGVQIELIEASAQPSSYKEFIEAGGFGIHHVGYMVKDYGAGVKAAEAMGFTQVQSGRVAETSFAYFDTGNRECGSIIELMEASPTMLQLYGMIRDASIEWDGKDPVRPIHPA